MKKPGDIAKSISLKSRSLKAKGPFIKYGGGRRIFRGGRLFFRKLRRGGHSVFREDIRGGPPIFAQENLKIECTIDQINCNINRQMISSNLYLKKFSGPPIMFLVFHVCSHFRRLPFHSFNLICYDHFSEWMNEA